MWLFNNKLSDISSEITDPIYFYMVCKSGRKLITDGYFYIRSDTSARCPGPTSGVTFSERKMSTQQVIKVIVLCPMVFHWVSRSVLVLLGQDSEEKLKKQTKANH